MCAPGNTPIVKTFKNEICKLKNGPENQRWAYNVLSYLIFIFYLRPLESQLRLQNKNSTGANSSIGGGNGGHNSRKDGNNNKNKAKRSTGGKKNFKDLSIELA